MEETISTDSLVERIGRLEEAAAGRRVVLGIAGPPGAGKSTLAAAITTRLGSRARLIPQDGFHLAQTQLDEQGKADRKGAPDTFDAAGFVSLLRRLRDRPDTEVYAPYFDRGLEEPIAGGIRVDETTSVVVTEGNYLLVDEPGWAEVREYLDECWYIDPPADLRVERLVRRHERFGRSPAQARDWVASVDEVNAELVARSRSRAQLCLQNWQ